ncbi:MAG: NAD(P)H-hydrate dehydratase [Woeseiaceae bacterium]
MHLPAEIYSVASVRNMDRTAINDAGIAGYTLMNRAGLFAFEAAASAYPQARRWQVICGGGNNGGDGYVVARLAAEKGITVSAVALSPPASLRGDAATAYADFTALGGVTVGFEDKLDAESELLVDGLLGSGLERELQGAYAQVVDAMNAHNAPVLALDIPTGLHADTGRALGRAVSADITVTFVGLKAGLFLHDGPDYVGSLMYSGLAIPDDCRAGEVPVLRRIDSAVIRQALPVRPRTAHKGDFGRVLIVGGAPGMPGAVRICGEAALRAGAGAVTIATHPTHSAVVPASRPELMCSGVATASDLEPLLENADVVAIGPGLGTDDWSQGLFAAAAGCGRPQVVDADALNLLASDPRVCEQAILTPHPGEAGRLLGKTAAGIQADRPAALLNLAARYGSTVVLKGAGSLVSSGTGIPWLCCAGNPGMAAPGMGDALTGIIVSLLAQGLTAEMASVVGVQVHAEAGDAAAAAGERGLLASDLVNHIRARVN